MKYPGKHGTLAEQLDNIARLGKPMPKELNGRPILEEVVLDAFENYIFGHWTALGNSRPVSDGTRLPITDRNFLDYMQLYEITLRFIDIEIIRHMDLAYLAAISEQITINQELE